MASRNSTSAANVATEGRSCLRSGWFHLLARLSPAETRKGLSLLSMSGALFPRPNHRRREVYVSARADARSNSNVGQGHTRPVAFHQLRHGAVPWRATAGYHSNTVALTPATPNPSIEGMPKRLRLLFTPHVKR
jgi:hypothetical protein